MTRIGFLGALALLMMPLPGGSAAATEYQQHPEDYTVEQAYEFFGRERTPYDRGQSPIPELEARYLGRFFAAADAAMQARVNIMQHFFAGQSYKKYMPVYLKTMQEIEQEFFFERAPTKELKDIETLFLNALGEQRDFFIYWSKASGGAFTALRNDFTKNELVQSSHTKLLKVYTQLMILYPNETAYNQKAFYNHLCALDFI